MLRTRSLAPETVCYNYTPSMGPGMWKALGAQAFHGGQAVLPDLHLLLLNQGAVVYSLPGEPRHSISPASVSTSVAKNCLLGLLKFFQAFSFQAYGLDVPT